MTLRARFALVTSGIIAFLIIAPVIIFLSRGFRYDFKTNKIIKTATLVVKTEPRDAEVFLNSKILGLTPLARRFVLPSDYELAITKDGFLPWKKRITIRQQQVLSFPPESSERIVLFRSNPEINIAPTTTIDLFETDRDTGEDELIKRPSEKVFDSAKVEDAIYYISLDKTHKLSRQSAGQTELLVALPNFAQGSIIVSPQRQVFVILDGTLYEVSEDLEKINSAVKIAHWDKPSQSLVYSNGNEIWLYNPQSNEPNQLVTRTTSILQELIFNKHTNYFFASSGKEIKAYEYDPIHGQPNIYTLYTAASVNPRFAVDAEGQTLFVLEGTELTSVKIR